MLIPEAPQTMASQEGHFGDGTVRGAGVESAALSAAPRPLGLYSVPEVASYIQANRSQVLRWATGYTFKNSQNQKQRSASVLYVPLGKADRSYVAAFPDLIELRVVHLFRKASISMPTIRVVVRRAARQFGTDYPLGSLNLLHDGQNIFREIDIGEILKEEDGRPIPRQKIVEDLKTGQTVMRGLVELKDFEFNSHSVSRWWPMGKQYRHCIIDPKINFGKPTDPDSRIPLDALFLPYDAGDSVETVMDWFGVEEEVVQTAIRFFEQFSHNINVA